jgi:filamentous hemagglutinin family protein
MSHLRFQQSLLAAALASIGLATYAQNLPVGGTVAIGVATINTAGSVMTVTQKRDNLVTNWKSFNIGSGNTVNFVQPSANSIAVNRVTGTTASAINGKLNANGTVILLNPNGIAFGKNSQVNVGGLVASTHTVDNAVFNWSAGVINFTNAGKGSVINEGSIRTAASNKGVAANMILLAARNVTNTGSLNADTVAMRAEQNLSMNSFYNATSNSGTTRDGRVLTSSLSVNNSGTIRASQVEMLAGNNGTGMKNNAFVATINNAGSVHLLKSSNNGAGSFKAYTMYNGNAATAPNGIVQTGHISAEAGSGTNSVKLWAFGGKLQATGINIGSAGAKTGVDLEGGAGSTISASNIHSGGARVKLTATNLNGNNVQTQGGDLFASGTLNGNSFSTSNGYLNTNGDFMGNNTLNVGSGNAVISNSANTGLNFGVNSHLSLLGSGGTYTISGNSNAAQNRNGITLERGAGISNVNQSNLVVSGAAKGATGAGIYMNAGSYIANLGNGTLAVAGTTTKGVGLDMSGASIRNAGTGQVALTGTSTDALAPNFGVRLSAGSVLDNAAGAQFSLKSSSLKTVSSLQISPDSQISTSIIKTDLHR